MSTFCTTHGLPRAAVDPIDSPAAALAVIELALHRPLAHQTIALVLEADRRGRTVLVVDGTDEPDAVLDVVERVVDSIAATGRTGCLVLATSRPGGAGPLEGDGDRWLAASDLADEAGVELLEWFVVDADDVPLRAAAWCPRDAVGEVPRWSRW